MGRDLRVVADQIRYWTLRELEHRGYGHFGGSLSIVEALAALYGTAMRYDPAHPDWPERDWFILSKGHAGPAWYATLAVMGFFGTDKLMTLNDNGTKLPSHPDRLLVPGVDMTTGSMGQGLSVASGIAYRSVTTGRDTRVYCLVGDGELNEGQCWEAIQFIGHHKLANLTVLVDDNKRQLDGWTVDIIDPRDFVEKFQAFGLWATRVDGHDVEAIAHALAEAKQRADVPTCVVLDTTKGQGLGPELEAADNHHMRLDDAARDVVRGVINELERRLSAAEVSYE